MIILNLKSKKTIRYIVITLLIIGLPILFIIYFIFPRTFTNPHYFKESFTEEELTVLQDELEINLGTEYTISRSEFSSRGIRVEIETEKDVAYVCETLFNVQDDGSSLYKWISEPESEVDYLDEQYKTIEGDTVNSYSFKPNSFDENRDFFTWIYVWEKGNGHVFAIERVESVSEENYDYIYNMYQNGRKEERWDGFKD